MIKTPISSFKDDCRSKSIRITSPYCPPTPLIPAISNSLSIMLLLNNDTINSTNFYDDPTCPNFPKIAKHAFFSFVDDEILIRSLVM